MGAYLEFMRVSRSPEARVNAEIQLSFPIERTASIARPPARRAARLYSDARACVEGTADGWRAAAIMVSGGGSREAGRKRKAAASPEAAAMRREPRRGLGVAELERIRVALEVAERCYAAPPQPAPAPPAALVVHGASLATVRHPSIMHARQVVSLIASNSRTIITSRDGDSLGRHDSDLCRSGTEPFSCNCRGDISPRTTSPRSSTNPSPGKYSPTLAQ